LLTMKLVSILQSFELFPLLEIEDLHNGLLSIRT
jgi:hypothetical protein